MGSNDEPMMVSVRSQGLKMDLVLRNNNVTGFSVDYQGVDNNTDFRTVLRLMRYLSSMDAFVPIQGSRPGISGDSSPDEDDPDVLVETAGSEPDSSEGDLPVPIVSKTDSPVSGSIEHEAGLSASDEGNEEDHHV